MTVSPHIPSDRDLELLSAYLDGELSDREKERLEQRLARESALRADLDDLRETVALVNDLPRLKAPRNFTLDPAVYGRPVPWWQRLFTLKSALQLSGAMGAVASVALIIVAVLLTQSSPNNASQPVSESAQIAMQATQTEPLVEETALAYSGDDLLQTTLAAQSMYYATLEATGTQVALDLAAPAGGESYPTATSAPTAEAQEMAAGAVAPAESEAPLAPQNEEPAPLIAQPGAYPPAAAQDTVSGAAPAPDAAQLSAAATPLGSAAVLPTSEGAFRETQRDENTAEADGAAANSAMNPPTSAAETMLVATPTPAPATQAEKSRPEEAPSTTQTAQRKQTRERSSSYWWLAGIGLVTLVFSIALIVWGNRRVRP
jgi:hypothetical protein